MTVNNWRENHKNLEVFYAQVTLQMFLSSYSTLKKEELELQIVHHGCGL